MKTISVAISTEDDEAFQRFTAETQRSVAQLIRDAMARYRRDVIASRPRLAELPVLVGHRPIDDLPERAAIYDEAFEP